MSGTGTRMMTVSGTTLTSLERMRRGTMACCQQCPILTLTLAPSLALPSPLHPCLPLSVSSLPLTAAVDDNHYRRC